MINSLLLFGFGFFDGVEFAIFEVLRLEELNFVLESASEVLPSAIFFLRPCCFGDCRDAWGDHVFEVVFAGDVLAPDVALATLDEFFLLLGEGR